MDRRNGRADMMAQSTVSWIIPDKYLQADNDVKDAVARVAALLKTQDFGDIKVDSYECKSIFTLVPASPSNFKDILYLATLLPLELEEPVEMWFAVKWTGAADDEDGKFDCKVKYRLGQWMLKICHEHKEVMIGDTAAVAKKKWIIRL